MAVTYTRDPNTGTFTLSDPYAGMNWNIATANNPAEQGQALNQDAMDHIAALNGTKLAGYDEMLAAGRAQYQQQFAALQGDTSEGGGANISALQQQGINLGSWTLGGTTKFGLRYDPGSDNIVSYGQDDTGVNGQKLQMFIGPDGTIQGTTGITDTSRSATIRQNVLNLAAFAGAVYAGPAAAGADAGSAGAGGWVSAEGGAGYLGGAAADQAALTAGNAAVLADGTVQTAQAAQTAAPAAGTQQAAPIQASQPTTVNSWTDQAINAAKDYVTSTKGVVDLAGAGLSLYGASQQQSALDDLQSQVDNANATANALTPPTAPPNANTPAATTSAMQEAQASGVPISTVLSRRNQSGYGSNSTWLTGPGGVTSPINVRANTLLGI